MSEFEVIRAKMGSECTVCGWLFQGVELPFDVLVSFLMWLLVDESDVLMYLSFAIKPSACLCGWGFGVC